MKNFLSIITILTVFSLPCFAEGLSVTLQRGDDMKPFYGVDAFKDALAEAEDSCVITLSPGLFNTADSILKSVTIRGTYGFNPSDNNATILPSLSVYANNVTVEGIYLSGNLTIGNVHDTYVKRCYINGILNSVVEHTNTLIDQCVVKQDVAISTGVNYCVRNSTIGSFGKQNTTSNIAYITNCVVWQFFDTNYPSGFNLITPSTPYAVYRNCLLSCIIYGFRSDYSRYGYEVHYQSPNSFSHCYFAVKIVNPFSGSKGWYSLSPSDCMTFESGCTNVSNIINGVTFNNTYPATKLDLGNGQDGTPIGIYGGTGFNEYPGMPRITASEIDQQTDAEGKINAKITVQVEQ